MIEEMGYPQGFDFSSYVIKKLRFSRPHKKLKTGRERIYNL